MGGLLSIRVAPQDDYEMEYIPRPAHSPAWGLTASSVKQNNAGEQPAADPTAANDLASILPPKRRHSEPLPVRGYLYTQAPQQASKQPTFMRDFSETCHDCKCCGSAGGANIDSIVSTVGNGGGNGDPWPALVRAEGKLNVRGARFLDATAIAQGDGCSNCRH